MKGIVVVVSVLASLVVPAAAPASSLVFNREDGNVWLANPDGSGLYQVTLDGSPGNPYGAPSQADDGTIVTTFGSGDNERIIRMRQNGEVLSDFEPAVEFALGLFDAEVTRDGSKVAYWTGFFGNSTCDPGSSGTTSCITTQVTSSTGPVDLGGVASRTNPSWITGTRLLTGGTNFGLSTLDLGESEVDWFSAGGPNDPEVSADGSRLVHTATAVLTGQEKLDVRETTGNPQTDEPGPAAPGGGCELTGPAGGQFDDPTFAPNGQAVAWEESRVNESDPPVAGEGIWTWDLSSQPDLSAGGACAALPVNVLRIPGGTNPDWGPADVNPGPRFVPPNPNPPQPPVPPCCTPPPDRTAPAFEGALALSASTFAAANRGASITRAPVGTRVRYRLSEAATVTFTVERQAAGRRVGRRCVKPTRANRRRPRCTRYVRVGSFVHRGGAGANSFKFTGRVRGRKLSPARYRLTGVAKDAANNTSAPRRVSFRIVRR
jgi:hypothetical protein